MATTDFGIMLARSRRRKNVNFLMLKERERERERARERESEGFGIKLAHLDQVATSVTSCWIKKVV